jgi:hypothetical protein
VTTALKPSTGNTHGLVAASDEGDIVGLRKCVCLSPLHTRAYCYSRIGARTALGCEVGRERHILKIMGPERKGIRGTASAFVVVTSVLDYESGFRCPSKIEGRTDIRGALNINIEVRHTTKLAFGFQYGGGVVWVGIVKEALGSSSLTCLPLSVDIPSK